MAGTNYKISFEAACPGEQAVELVADVFEPLPSSNEEPKVGAVSALSGMVCVVMGWGVGTCFAPGTPGGAFMHTVQA